ncbi:MAG: hypothetical protein IPM22_11615 [Betaproteobacteria bacterium]|nr:hypothetical protein [Betaproteobacteria bacterium]
MRREFALQQVRCCGSGRPVVVPTPRRAAGERRAALRRPRGQLRVGAVEGHLDADRRRAGAARVAQREGELCRRVRAGDTDRECVAVGLADEAAAGGRRMPAPGAGRRDRRDRGLRDHAAERLAQRRQQRALHDGHVDAAVAPARRRDEVLLLRGSRELVVERERSGRGDAVGGHRGQHDAGEAHDRRREHGLAPFRVRPRPRRTDAGAHAPLLRVEQRPRVVARGRRCGRQDDAQRGHWARAG